MFHNFNRRLFFLYGLTRDRFITPQLRDLSLEQWIFVHLRENGYRRIIYYSPLKKIHFIDEDSAVLAQVNPTDSSVSARPSSRLKAGPLGTFHVGTDSSHSKSIIPLPKKSKKSNDVRMDFGAMTDSIAIGAMNKWMREDDVSTGIIFSNGDDLFYHLDHDAARLWDDAMHSWLKLPTNNKNIAIFVHQQVLPHGDTLLPSLSTLLFPNESNISNPKHTIYIGRPHQDEIWNYLHRQRLLGEIGWTPLQIEKKALSISQNLIPEYLGQQEGGICDLVNNTEFNMKVSSLSGMEQLKNMKGREGIQSKIEQLVRTAKYYQEMNHEDVTSTSPNHLKRLSVRSSRCNDKHEINLHLALLGNPGTGKTHIAKIIARIFKEEGILESGHLVKVTSKDLVAGYVGQTSIRTAEAIERAMGGMLFIDEAYQLSEGNNFGKEAIETLMEAMSDRNGQFAVLIAGYTKKITDFITAPNSNPGLSRRFPVQNRWLLDDYTPDVLLDIFYEKLHFKDFDVESDLVPQLPKAFKRWYDQRDAERFGNVGDVENLVTNLTSHALAAKHDKIMFSDFDEIGWNEYLVEYKKINTDTLFTELNEMVGLKQVKKKIHDLANRLKMAQLRGEDVSIAPGHYIFSGNPGTGKTSVARLMGKLFKQLGLLSKGHVVEVKREDLIGTHIGDTENITKNKIREALNGVFFIDEAYQLTQDEKDHSDFGKKSAEVLLTYMLDNSDRLCVIAAGYPDLMNQFIASNPGFKSRFTETIHFDDYDTDEMMQIGATIFRNGKFSLSTEAEKKMHAIMADWGANHDKDFGNARDVAKLIERIKTNQDNRLSLLATNNISKDVLYLIEAEDVPDE